MRKIDLSGQRFGSLTVIRQDGVGCGGQALWLCECDCGNIKTFPGYNLRAGRVADCGCEKAKKPPPAKIDLTGQRFGRLDVKRFVKLDGFNQRVWECICNCGNTTYVATSSLTSGKTRSCGCLYRDTRAPNRTHGGSKERLYSIWKNMNYRCSSSKAISYSAYGGRGITVCDAWKSSYPAFRGWALMNGYDNSLTLDRVDADGNYTPQNCRWVSMSVQDNNKRTNIYIEYKGVIKTRAEWSKMFGVSSNSIKWWLNRGGDLSHYEQKAAVIV